MLVGAAYGALWESGAMNRVWSWLFAGTIDARGLIREVLAFVVGSGPLPTGRLVLLLGGIAGFLVLVRLISMVWAFVRLYDFRLTRRGQDLRITYGLFTRVTATIPVGRIQTLTVHQGWLHRRFRRASIRVETAGGRQARPCATASGSRRSSARSTCRRSSPPSCRAWRWKRCHGSRSTRGRFVAP